jgi:hypothetical protein
VQVVVSRVPRTSQHQLRATPAEPRHPQPGGDISWNAEDMAKKDGVIEI